MRSICISFLLLGLSIGVSADSHESIIRYESEPELGYVQVRNEDVRGAYVDKLYENKPDFAKLGVFCCASDEIIVYNRAEKIGENTVETRITLIPAARVGYGGYNATATVEIRIDGKKEVNCHVGYYPSSRFSINSITVYPGDGVIQIEGNFEDGHRFDYDTSLFLFHDENIITDDVFHPMRCSTSSTESEPQVSARGSTFRDFLLRDMKDQILDYLKGEGGWSMVGEIQENVFGIDSAVFKALFDLRKEGKVSWAGGKDIGLSLSTEITLVLVEPSAIG